MNNAIFSDLPLGESITNAGGKSRGPWYHRPWFKQPEVTSGSGYVDNSTRIFVIQALVAWAVLCIPGNVTALILWFQPIANSTTTTTTTTASLFANESGGGIMTLNRYNSPFLFIFLFLLFSVSGSFSFSVLVSTFFIYQGFALIRQKKMELKFVKSFSIFVPILNVKMSYSHIWQSCLDVYYLVVEFF